MANFLTKSYLLTQLKNFKSVILDNAYLGKTDKAASATTADSATTATTAGSATKATQDASGNVITSTYATKTENNAKYTKPSTGIPATDLASGVIPTSLPASDVKAWAKADSKPTYTASEVGALASTVTHLSGDIATSQKGTANGVATLDANGLVPSSQLPSFVDDVLEYSAKSSFPTTGETGKIYVDTAKNLTYRWSGTAYVEISPSIALGETSSTAYAGDKGKANADAISALQTSVAGKQASLSATQLNAVNSGITSTKVSTYDGYASTIASKGTYSKPSGGIPASDLASGVIPTSLKNPKALTINGTSYDGSSAVTITTPDASTKLDKNGTEPLKISNSSGYNMVSNSTSITLNTAKNNPYVSIDDTGIQLKKGDADGDHVLIERTGIGVYETGEEHYTIISPSYIDCTGSGYFKGGVNSWEGTQAQYNTLVSQGKIDPKIDYYITDGGDTVSASTIPFTSTSGLTSKNVNTAIDEVNNNLRLASTKLIKSGNIAPSNTNYFGATLGYYVYSDGWCYISCGGELKLANVPTTNTNHTIYSGLPVAIVNQKFIPPHMRASSSGCVWCANTSGQLTINRSGNTSTTADWVEISYWYKVSKDWLDRNR